MAGTEALIIGLIISTAASAASSAIAGGGVRLMPVDKGRFDDIRIQGSEYGGSIPIVYGRARMSGNIIWSDGVQPWVTTTPGRSGKGGGHTAEAPSNNYTYTTNLAIAICEGVVQGGLKRIWENAKVTANIDSPPLPSGTQYEIESTANVFIGGARIIRDISASGEYKVELPTINSAVKVQGIDISQAGSYDIKVTYMCLGTRSCEVLIDNTSIGTVVFPSTGGNSIISSLTVPLAIPHVFSQGTHSIEFRNSTGAPAPYLDALGCYGNGVLVAGSSFEIESGTMANGAVSVFDSAASSSYKVSLPNTNSYVQLNSVSVDKTGTYDIKIGYMRNAASHCEIIVDGDSLGTFLFPTTYGDSSLSYKTIQYTFTAGTHSIRFRNSNGTGTAPFLDTVGCYSLVTITPTSVTGIVNTDASFVDPNNPTGPALAYPPNAHDPSDYYNARFIPDDTTGTATGGQYNNSNPADVSALGESIDDKLADPYTIPGGGSGDTPGGSATGGTSSAAFTFYNGSETQLPDMMMESIDGVGSVPAYRGTCYITFNKYQIPNGQMPSFSFEVDEGTHDLAQILISLWNRVGLDSSQLDVTQLEGTFVEGLVINSRSSLSSVIEPLSIAFGFDFVDVNGAVTAIKRGSGSIVTIPEDDLRAHEDGQEVPAASIEATYANIEQLPNQIDVSYMDRAKDYHQNAQPAFRQIGYSKEPQTLTLPLVLSANQAKEIGVRVLNTVHLQRASFAFTLPPKYAYLSPSDVITVVLPTVTYVLRITNFQNGLPGMAKVQAVLDSPTLYTNNPVSSSGTGNDIHPIAFPANTQLALMDIPPLVPENSGFGFYAAACGKGLGEWLGAHLYKEEIPDSNIWERIGGFEIPATMGIVGNALSASPTISGSFDTSSSIVVQMYQGTLESYTQAELLANPALNLCYIGGEMCQFATAVLNDKSVYPFARQYTLTNIIRGQNGTSAKIGGHVNDEQFVLINNAVKYMRQQAAALYLDYLYKAVTVGQPLIGAEIVTFNTGNGSAPPVVTNLSLTQVQQTSADGIAFMVIRGTFTFGSYVGGQKAKVLIERPGDSAFHTTGIIVLPDASNNGAFEVPATVNGSYTIKVVSTSTFEHQLPEPPNTHPQSTIVVAADTTPPTAPSAPTATLVGQQIVWVWTASTDPRHAYYQVANGSGAVLTDAHILNTNSYTEYPDTSGGSTIQRKIIDVNNLGVASAPSSAGSFTVTTPSVPTSYALAFDGYSLLHSWAAQDTDTTFGVDADGSGSPSIINGLKGTTWAEGSPGYGSRTLTRYLRSTRFGVSSAYTSAVSLTISAPSAPTVAFDESRATPFVVPLTITVPGGLDRRYIRYTQIEIRNSANTTTLNTYTLDGVAETFQVSGRFLDAPNNVINARVAYIDAFGIGSYGTTGTSHTFPAIVGGTDIAAGTITARNLIVGGMSDNLLSNPSFEELDGTGFPSNWSIGKNAGATSIVRSGDSKAVQVNDQQNVTSRIIPVIPGSVIVVKFTLWGPSPAAANFRLNILLRATMPTSGTYNLQNYVGWGGADGTSAYDTYVNVNVPITGAALFDVTTTPTVYETQFTVPASMYWMSIAPTAGSASAYVDDFVVKQQLGDAFITTVHADKISANVGDIGIILSDQIKQRDYTSYKNGTNFVLNDGWDYTWGSLVSYDVENDQLNYTGSATFTNTGTVETQYFQKIIAGTNGYLQFTPITKTTSHQICGGLRGSSGADFGAQSAGQLYYALDYSWLLNGTNAYVYESSTSIFNAGSYNIGDVFRVGVEDGYVRFRKNGKLVYTSAHKPSVGTIRSLVNPDFQGAILFADTGSVNSVVFVQEGRGVGWRLNPLSGGSFYGQEPIWEHPVINSGSGATVTATVSGGAVTGFTSLVGGSGYPSSPNTPQIIFTGGGGTGATAHTTVSGGVVTSVVLDSGGTGYTTAPTVRITGGATFTDLNMGSYVQKIGGDAVWDTSIFSQQSIASGDGWVQFTLTGIFSVSFIGLTADTAYTDPDYHKIKFSFFIFGSNIYMFEDGVISLFIAPAVTGDIYRISIEGGVVVYRRNGSVVYTSGQAPVYPMKVKMSINYPDSKVDQVYMTASSSGLGEFNSGISVRGQRLEDIVRLSTQSLRSDNRYRGNDIGTPSNDITAVGYDTYKASFEDSYAFISLFLTISDYKTNSTKNLDSTRSVRVRVWNKFGVKQNRLTDSSFPWSGRGVCFTGMIPRDYCDPKQEAMYSFEIENLYGYSRTIWYSEAAWKGAWTAIPNIPNASYSLPTWIVANDCPTNCSAIVQSESSVTVNWTKAANYTGTSHDVGYRVFKDSGYEGSASNNGFTVFGTSSTGTSTVTGLLANTRYEFAVRVTGHADTWSNLAYGRTLSSVAVSAPLYTAPLNLAGSNGTSGQIDLTWVKNDSANYTKTEIYWVSGVGVPTSSDTQLGTGFTGTSTSDTGLSTSVTKSYRARNNYSSGAHYSEWSNVVTITTQPAAPASDTPSNLYLTVIGFYSIIANWTLNGGATSTDVELDYDGGDFSSPIASLTISSSGTNAHFNGLLDGTPYQARAKKTGGSVWSNIAYASTFTYTETGCVLEDTEVTAFDYIRGIYKIYVQDGYIGQQLLAFNSITGERVISAIRNIFRFTTDTLYIITTVCGKVIPCSASHPILTGLCGGDGKAADQFVVGDQIKVYDEDSDQLVTSEVGSIEILHGEFNVITYEMASEEHTFLTNDILSHNIAQK